MAKTFGWVGVERGLSDSRKFVRYQHADYPGWEVYRPEGLNRPLWPYCFLGEGLPPRLANRCFKNFEHINETLAIVANEFVDPRKLISRDLTWVECQRTIPTVDQIANR